MMAREGRNEDTMSIYYRRPGDTEWTRDRECYGSRQDDRRVAKLQAQGYEVVVRD